MLFLLIIPIAILNGLINARAINMGKFGVYWHDIQVYILVILMASFVWAGIVKLDEIILVLSLYYASFEISVNRFRKPRKKWNYTGYTSKMDRFIRKNCQKYMMPNHAFIFIKMISILIGLTIYLIW